MTLLVLVLGFMSGASAQLTWLAGAGEPVTAVMIVVRTVAAGHAGAALFWVTRAGLRRLADRFPLPAGARVDYRRLDAWPFAVFSLTALCAAGLQLLAPVVAGLVALFVLAEAALLAWVVRVGAAGARVEEAAGLTRSPVWLAGLFLVSGFAALIYQVVWQRALFGALGVNTESVTIIVSVFMLGLGLGALAGGGLSERFDRSLPAVFMALELGIGVFGAGSLWLISRVAAVAGGGLLEVAAAAFGLLLVPTVLMGATLPILVAYLDLHMRDVGRSVGLLYFMNTLGSALAAVVTVDVLFAVVGLRGASWVAAGLNLAVGVLVFLHLREPPRPARVERPAFVGSA